MAFSQPNAQRELQNRKILEELQLKKQMLLKQGPASTVGGSSASATSAPAASLGLPSSTIPATAPATILPQASDLHPMNTSHRAALNNANATSCGFFVPQDSSFGNQILPVLPRFDSK